MNTLNKLQFYFKNKKNVLLSGPHGVGKTSIVKEVFESNGLVMGQDCLIFSAATMDPWTDLIGIPYPVKSNNETEVKYLKPSHIDESKIQAIFFDEYNRSHKKIRNAVMELIQFKSINGRKFENLKVVWAAINPDDHESHTYDVEPLDPAQKDRFHIHIKIENELSREFFIKKFGSTWTDSAFDWWSNLPEKIKEHVSPRRLEYALEIYSIDGDVKDVLPESSLPSKLAQALSQGSPKQKFIKIIDSNNGKHLKEFLKDFSNVHSIMDILENNEDVAKKCMPHIPAEAMVNLVSRSYKIRKFIENRISEIKQIPNEEIYKITEEQKMAIKIVADMAKVESDKTLSNWAKGIRKSIMPGSSIIDEETLTAKETFQAAKERYKIKDSFYKGDISQFMNNKKSYKEYDKKHYSNWKNSIKTGNTYERASAIADLAKENKFDDTDWRPYLDCVEEYVKRSQKKTINNSANKSNVESITSWAIEKMIFDQNLNNSSYEIHDRESQVFHELVNRYPNVFVKIIADDIENNHSFGQIEFTQKAKMYASI